MRYSDVPTTAAETHIDASPARVWQLVTDFGLMATISSELRAVEWLDGADGPALGHRFLGRNFHRAMGEWETTSIIVAYDEPREFAWAVTDTENPTSVWRFTLRPDGAGTALTQWMQMGPAPSGLNRAIERMPDKEERIVEQRLGELRAAMERNLAEYKRLGEARTS